MNSKDVRCERKFLVSQLRPCDLEHLVKLHPSMFNEIFYERFVNNIYFDSFAFQHYWDNVCGGSSRQKVRIRWYGDLFGEISKPVLELKIKEGFTNRKKSYPLNVFTLNNRFTGETILDLLHKSDVPAKLLGDMKSLEPKLLNTYSRKYFLSHDKLFRVTIDKDMEFMKIGSCHNLFMQSVKDNYQTVLELKYAHAHDNTADTIAGCFPFRLTRSSKYVTGIERLYKQFS